MTDRIEAKADRYLVEGRVAVVEVTPTSAAVRVTGSSPYVVRASGGVWACPCPARVDRCAHVVAASKVVDVHCGPTQLYEPSTSDVPDLSSLRREAQRVVSGEDWMDDLLGGRG